MYTGRESMEEVTNDIKRTFYRSFEKEGEIAYITLNLESTKNEILSAVPESDYEKEYLKVNYKKILDMIKKDLKQSDLIFKDEGETREKQELISKINNLYIEFEQFYEKSKNKYGEFNEEIERWDLNITGIYNIINMEFSTNSLEKIYYLIDKNNKRIYYTTQIIDKSNYYSGIIQSKTEEIKQCQIKEKQRKKLIDKIEQYTKYLTTIDLQNKINNDELKNIIDNIEKQGQSILNDIKMIIDDDEKQRTIDEDRLNNEVEGLTKTIKRFMIFKFLFGDKNKKN